MIGKVELGVVPPDAVLERTRSPWEELIEAADELLAQAVASKNDESQWARRIYDTPEMARKGMVALNRQVNKGSWAQGDHRLMLTVDEAALYFCVMPKDKVRRAAPRRLGHGPETGAAGSAKATASGGMNSSCKTCHQAFANRFELGKHYKDKPSHRALK